MINMIWKTHIYLNWLLITGNSGIYVRYHCISCIVFSLLHINNRLHSKVVRTQVLNQSNNSFVNVLCIGVRKITEIHEIDFDGELSMK